MTDDTTTLPPPLGAYGTANLAVEGAAGGPLDGKISRPQATLSAGDTFLSLNGYDELAITEAFGTTVSKLRETKEQTTFMRALAFIDMRRKLQGHQGAHAMALDSAQLLTLQEVMDYFPDDDEDEDSD